MKELIIQYKKYFFLGGIFLLGIFYFLFSSATPKTTIEESPEEFLTIPEEQTEEKLIWFDIKGAVNKPGTYSIKEGSRIVDAISLAGGFTDDADASNLNLSKVLQDEMVLIIYTQEEVEKMKQTNIDSGASAKECICPETTNDACIQKEDVVSSEPEQKENSTPSIAGKISINTASVQELMTLPGIGEKKAQDIIAYRNANGPFESLEELKNVKGIGNATYEKLKDDIML